MEQIKGTIISKVRKAIENYSDNERISVKDFSSIKYIKSGKFAIFYHESFKNVNIKFKLFTEKN